MKATFALLIRKLESKITAARAEPNDKGFYLVNVTGGWVVVRDPVDGKYLFDRAGAGVGYRFEKQHEAMQAGNMWNACLQSEQLDADCAVMSYDHKHYMQKHITHCERKLAVLRIAA